MSDYGIQKLLMMTVAIPTIGLVVACAETNPGIDQTEKPPGLEPPRVYVANESSNSVSVLDGGTFKVLKEIDTLNHATHDLALSRDGKRLFATNLASGRLSVVDTDSLETVASLYTGKRCHVVTLTNDNRHAWVANIEENTVSIVDTTLLRILGTIPVGKGPMGIAFSRDGHYGFVTNQDKTVAVVDTSSHTVIKKIPVGTNPHFVILAPDGYIWGANTGDSNVFVIDPKSLELLSSVEVGPAPQQIAFGYKGTAGPNAYVTVSGLNKVVVVRADPANPKILEQIDVGTGPNGIWANPVGTRLYVGNSGSNDLQVIDTGTSKVIEKVGIGKKPIRVVASR
jgi:YVTN family beta-propeller protein